MNQEYGIAKDQYPRNMAIGRYDQAIDNAITMIEKIDEVENIPRLKGLLEEARLQQKDAVRVKNQNWFTARMDTLRFW